MWRILSKGSSGAFLTLCTSIAGTHNPELVLMLWPLCLAHGWTHDLSRVNRSPSGQNPSSCWCLRPSVTWLSTISSAPCPTTPAWLPQHKVPDEALLFPSLWLCTHCHLLGSPLPATHSSRLSSGVTSSRKYSDSSGLSYCPVLPLSLS